MIVWCPKCKTNPLEDPAPWEPWCAECVYSGYPRRYVLGAYEAPEYFAPHPDPVRRTIYTLTEITRMLEESWDQKISNWTVTIGEDPNPCIVLGGQDA